MHEGIKPNNPPPSIRMTIQPVQYSNQPLQKLIPVSEVQAQTKVMPRTYSQNQNIGFNQIHHQNPHTEFMSNAHNAFMKKNHPSVY